MKTSTLILLAAGLAALYFFVLKPRTAAAGVPVQAVPLPRVQPPSSGGTDWADLGIKYGTDLIGDTIGSIFG